MDNLKNKIKNKLKNTLILLMIVIFLLPTYNIKYGQVLGTHQYDTGGGIVTTLDAGEYIKIPTEIPQNGGSWESEDVSWGDGSRQLEVNKIWNEQGKTYTNEHWAYVTTNKGEKRLLVALSSIYGETGSYVDIYVNHNGKEEVYPCVMGDAKNAEDKTTHWWPNESDPNRVTYGHKRRRL